MQVAKVCDVLPYTAMCFASALVGSTKYFVHSRSPQVAEACMSALQQPAASNKTLEVFADWDHEAEPSASLFRDT